MDIFFSPLLNMNDIQMKTYFTDKFKIVVKLCHDFKRLSKFYCVENVHKMILYCALLFEIQNTQ